MSSKGAHRLPPTKRPPFVVECDERERRLGPGYCKVCEKIIPKADGTPHRGRNYCSPDCRQQVDMAWRTFPTMLSRGTVRRALGRQCATPGCTNGGDEIDHIKALCLLTPEERLDPKWWTLENMQMLCHDCHVTKTREDMRQLKALKLEAQQGLFTGA